MVILGLTGSIAMGKSTAANAFRRLGVPVHDSDAVVHNLMNKGGGAVDAVEGAFPGVVRDGAVNRAMLGQRVFGDAAALARLEGILHPRVGASRDHFLKAAARRRAPVVVLDIPLLFEVGADAFCDAVCVVSAPAFLQRIRVLSRPGMTEDRLRTILARQMPDIEKRRRADFVIPTGLGREVSLRHIRNVVRVARTMTGCHWPPFVWARRAGSGKTGQTKVRR